MRRRFVLTPEAKSDLREILLGIAEDSPAALSAFDPASTKPFSAWANRQASATTMTNSWTAAIASGTCPAMPCGYVWERKPIQIIAVVHGARDLESFFNSRLNRERSQSCPSGLAVSRGSPPFPGDSYIAEVSYCKNYNYRQEGVQHFCSRHSRTLIILASPGG